MKKLEEDLKYLRLGNLLENIDTYLKDAEKRDISRIKFLKNIFEKESTFKREKARFSRVRRAKIPINYTIETFPFSKQKHLNKSRILQRHDSLDYIEKNKSLIFIGPTGCGKSGLATSFLINAINNGHTGRFITFHDLMEELYTSQADHSGRVLVNKYSKIECLCIDEVGYMEMDKAQAGLFFSLIQQRHKKTCTLITTNLGFEDWVDFFKDKHLTAAIIDRLTDGGHVINMVKAKSIREKPEID